MIRKVCALIAFSPALLVHAQGNVKGCDRADITQNELNQCASDRAAVVDQELDAIYQSVLRSVSGDKALTLQIKASERKWIQYRDSYLRAAYPTSGPHADNGSMLPMEVDELRSELTRQQIEHLSYLKRLYGG